jgi:hypothetical protein
MTTLRYLLYVLFVAVALVFWPLFMMGVLDMHMIPGAEPRCVIYPPCEEPGFFLRLIRTLTFFGAIPLTALGFAAYRRWVHRILSKSDD